MGLTILTRGEVGLTTHPGRYDFNYRNGCAACPLRGIGRRVEPYGSTEPVIYILGEAPGREEVKEGRPFVGVSGQMLRMHLPKRWRDDDAPVRWNNCLKTRPPDNRTPTQSELASCRKFLEDDIIATKPKAIFGFGAVPLEWFGLASGGITLWAGRRVPVKVGEHTCWYFPMMHPSYVARSVTDFRGEARDRFRTELEFAFHVHLKNACELVDDIDALGEPIVYSSEEAMAGIDTVTTFNDASVDRIIDFIDSLYDEAVTGLDYETNAFRPYNNDAKILTAAMAGSNGTLAWPILHRESKWSNGQLDAIENKMADFFKHSKSIKAAHNVIFEYEWTGFMYGKSCIRGPKWGCSMSQGYILDERQGSRGDFGPQSLEWGIREYFGFSIKGLNPVDVANLDDTPLPEVLTYNGPDAKWGRKLFIKQRNRINREGLTDVYDDHQRRNLAAALTQMKGIPVQPAASAELLEKYSKLRDDAASRLLEHDAAKDFFERRGYDLKPSAPKDILFLLNHVLPKSVVKKARNREGEIPNVTEATLANVDHPIIHDIIDYRKCNKVISTYIEPVMPGSKLVYDDGLLHPQTRTTTVVTWRTSSDGPNYQNWTKRDEVRREVRKQIGKKGHKVVSFDYAGIQARNVAMESLDPALVEAFNTGYDIHADWTEQILRLAPRWAKEGAKELARNQKLFKAYRNIAKNKFVFPSFFGARSSTVAHYLGLEDEVGERLHELFWTRFSGIRDWHDRLFDEYRDTGYVTGLSGFRRRAPIAQNELINTPIQGDEAKIVLDAMCRLSETRNPALQPNMEIHDDLTFVWPTDEVERHAVEVIDIMLNVPFKWAKVVPLGVEWSIGDNWYDQKAAGEYNTHEWRGSL